MPWPVRRRRVVQLALLAVALTFWAWKMTVAWPALPVPTTYGPGVTGAEFPRWRFTRADLEAYAAGERSDGRLIDALRAPGVGPGVGLQAALVAPAGGVSEPVVSYGWPVPILSSRVQANYTDIYERAGATASSAGLMSRWVGWTHVVIRLDAEGRKQRRHIYPEALVAGAVVVILAWMLGSACCTALAALGLAGRRRLRLLAPLCAIVAAILVGLLSSIPRSKPAFVSWPATPVLPPTFDTGLEFADLPSLARTVDGESQLARAILDSVPAASALPNSQEPVLLYAYRVDHMAESAHASGGWPAGLSITRSGPVGYAATGWNWTGGLDGHAIIVKRTSLDGAATAQWGYSLLGLSKVIGGALLVWLAAGATLSAWRRLITRRAAKRAAAGACLACGYDLRASP